MKKFLFAIVFASAFVYSSCNESTGETSNDSADLDVLVTPEASNVPAMPKEMHSDLNFVDADGKKQGKWIIYGKMSGDAKYNPTSKFEEGSYKDGEKDGEWILYNPDGSEKAKVNFREGKEVK